MRTAFYAPAQLISAPAQLITAPAQLITAPAQPPATGVAVYTALFLFVAHPYEFTVSVRDVWGITKFLMSFLTRAATQSKVVVVVVKGKRKVLSLEILSKAVLAMFTLAVKTRDNSRDFKSGRGMKCWFKMFLNKYRGGTSDATTSSSLINH